MEMVMLLLVFIIIGMIGFAIMKKVDTFLEENQSRQMDALKNREDVIRIVCENPIMLPYISEKIEKNKKEFNGISFHFYTGCREDIEKALENGNYDIILLMGETSAREYEHYEKKTSSFVPGSISELLTGMIIEPIENQKAIMYVLWNEKYITETKRKMISMI